ncbi:response regulator [Antarctobacter jejuensis]|uniref:response regulator n=1 Tax=Antarctobacter jejuensis TaxID=1439938 RepID=UPI003FD1F2F2
MSRQMNILLVEDNSLDAMMIQRALSKVAPDATVTHATDGIEALNLLAAGALRHPYFILLDINMPRMNGHEFLQALQQNGSDANSMVFMFTTSDSPHDIARAYKGRANGYIVKPHNREGMRRILDSLHEFWSICEPPLAENRCN